MHMKPFGLPHRDNFDTFNPSSSEPSCYVGRTGKVWWHFQHCNKTILIELAMFIWDDISRKSI